MASKLLVVIGCLDDEDHIKRVVKSAATGIEAWIEPLPLEEQEEVAQTLNSIPAMKSIPNRNAEDGTVVSRYRGRILDTTVLISPTSENLHTELVDLFLAAPPRCLIAFGGFVTEDSANWILQDGLFSFNNFREIFDDPKVTAALSEHSTKVSIACCKLGLWKTTEGVFSPESKITLEIMDSHSTHVFDQNGAGDHSSGMPNKEQTKIEQFTSFLEDGIGNELRGIFSTLEHPHQEGFLKIRKPCLYIFPGGSGDSAFFAVNGFNMLVNGGACSKPWFWKLIQHVDRVDSILATHLGSDNLPGLNSLLLRKLQERQVKLPMDNTTPEYQDLRRCLISPDLGPLFINAPVKFRETVNRNGSASDKNNGKVNGASPSNEENLQTQPILKTVDVVKETLRLSKALSMEMVPLVRKNGSNDPITLFSKVGLGRLEMYVLSPAEGSKELTYINEKWGSNGKTPNGKTGIFYSSGTEFESSVTNLSSICALLVWHPSNPNEKITRVLFPGNASQNKIFEGLETIKNLPFMKLQHATKNLVTKQKQPAKSNGTTAPQKTTRPGVAASAAKKAPATSVNKTTGISAPPKKEIGAASKVSEKKTKAERPSSTKTKPAPMSKAPTVKDRASAKSMKTDAATSKHTAPKKPATSHPTSAATASKADSKRAATTTSAKLSGSKPKPSTPVKVAEKPKKPQTLATTKQKADAVKATVKKSPKPAAKKAQTKVQPEKEKGVKKSKTPVPVVTATPPEDLTAEFAKLDSETEKTPKPVEPLSIGSEEPTSSVLSDRHSPEGEDGSTIQYAESPSLTQHEKAEKPESSKDGRVEEAPEQSDAGFVIMNKPEISEDSDMISTNGSSAAAPQQTPIEDELMPPRKPEDDFLSSDKSTPSQEEQQPTEKTIKFEETAATESGHKAVERLPTPFHSLQESSGTSETSPISETESGAPPVVDTAPYAEQGVKVDQVPEVDAESGAPPVVDSAPYAGQEVNIDQVPEVDTENGAPLVVDTAPYAEQGVNIDQVPETDAENMAIAEESKNEIPEKVVDSGDEEMKKIERELVCEIPENKQGFDIEITKDEQLLEMAPAQIQEPEKEDIPKEQEVMYPNPCDIDYPITDQGNNQQEMDDQGIEEQFENILAEPKKDIGSEVHSSFNSSIEGSYELYPAERSPPPQSAQETIAETISDFKHDEQPADVDLEDPSASLDTQPQQVELFEDPTMSMEAPDQRYSMSTTSTGSQFARMDPPFSLSDAGISISKEQSVTAQQETEELRDQKKDEMPEADQDNAGGLQTQTFEVATAEVDEQPKEGYEEKYIADEYEKETGDVDYQLHATEENTDMPEDSKLTPEVESYRQQVCTAYDEDTNEQVAQEETNNIELHAPQHIDIDAGDDFDENGIMVTDGPEAPGEENANQLIDFAEEYVKNQQKVTDMGEEIHVPMAGSLASSAQDQDPDENSEATSLATETADTSEAQEMKAGVQDDDDDGPNIKDYIQMESGVVATSDLALESPEEKFVLHGGKNIPENLIDVEKPGDNENDPFGQINMNQPDAPRTYLPAYVDPSAPLADTEEVEAGIDELKTAELDSPLDVNAKPFIPKSSVPIDQSPTYAAEAHFGQGDAFAGDEGYNAAAPTSPQNTNNPFLMDLMANAQTNPFAAHEPVVPPVRGPDPCAAQDKTGKGAVKKSGQGSAASRKPSGPSPIYVDLAYVPNHGNQGSVGVEFFKKIRARYYVISGNDQSRDEPSADVLNHLLEGRKSWFSEAGPSNDQDDTNVTVIPTYDTKTVREWYKQNFKELESCNTHMVASGSKVMVQHESIDACKIEF